MRFRIILLFLFKLNAFQREHESETLISRIINHEGTIYVSNGFVGSKSLEILKNIIKTGIKRNLTDKEKDMRVLYISGFLWNFAKFNFKLELKLNDKNVTFSIKPFFYDYDNYFIPVGCLTGYPGPECIFRRIGFCLINTGLEFYYNSNKSHVFSYNMSIGLNIIGKKIIPVDIILSYSPLVYKNNKNLYIELNTNFSLFEFIKKILISTVDYHKLHKQNWDLDSTDHNDKHTKELVNQFIKKNEDIRNGKISKAKFILVDGLLWSLIYNIRLYIGVKIL